MRSIKMILDYPDLPIIFEHLREREEAVFLDSSLAGELGQFSIIACRPYLKLVKEQGRFLVNGEKSEEQYLDYLKKYLEEHYEENETGLPLVSGAIGYFSYDFGQELMDVSSRHERALDIPDSILYFYDVFLIENHEEKKLYLVANGQTEEALQTILKFSNFFAGLNRESYISQKVRDSGEQAAEVIPDFTKTDYKTAVDHMIRYIVDGDIYVVNMTQQLQIKSACTPYEMFQILRKQNPSPFGAFMEYGDFSIVCASPERFLKMKQGKIETRPIKGTRKRGETDQEDLLLKQELAESEKDQSELLMIVDLERNDLNRVCVPGSVNVTELFKVETYATVFHLIANVEGQLKAGLNAVDLLKAAFPGGSITGAPKLRAMELIDQEEHDRRNLYTGSIGYLSLNGDCDLNIVIRTAVYKDGIYHIGVGGGITCESDTEFEYEETWQKARALLKALGIQQVKGDDYEYTVG